MIQPFNISDMQPGSACSTVIILCIIIIFSMLLAGYGGYFIPMIILAACIGYAPLRLHGKNNDG